MNIRRAFAAPRPFLPALEGAILLAFLLAPAAPRAANLQTQDILFFSTHKNPLKVVGDDKTAYVLTEGGVLVYDYRRKAWADNLAPDSRVQDIRWSSARSRLYALTGDSKVLEYNTAFRRFTGAAEADWNRAGSEGGEGAAADLNGLTLDGDWFFTGDALRDRLMRKAPIAAARVFEYDNLWILTSGLGPFLGSVRRKRAAPAWFGLDDARCYTIHPEGNDIWFSGCRPDGALVRASADLGSWKVHPAQLEFGFGDGCVHDVRAWRDYIWLATDKGVVRHDPRRGQFKAYSHMQGTTYIPVHALHVHQGLLYAGTEEGASFLSDPAKGEFESMPMPTAVSVPVYEFESKDKDLWAATRYGLYLWRKEKGWQTLKEVTGMDVPESYGQLIPSVKHHDTTLYWLNGGKIMFKPRGAGAKILFDRDRPFRMRLDGSILYVAFHGGVTAWDLRKNLWTDFRLEDGMPGTRVLSMAVSREHLWVGTDLGVARIRIRPYLP